MNLPVKCIKEYKDIYKNRLGVDLNDSEAQNRAENMLKLLYLLVNASKT